MITLQKWSFSLLEGQLMYIHCDVQTHRAQQLQQCWWVIICTCIYIHVHIITHQHCCSCWALCVWTSQCIYINWPSNKLKDHFWRVIIYNTLLVWTLYNSNSQTFPWNKDFICHCHQKRWWKHSWSVVTELHNWEATANVAFAGLHGPCCCTAQVLQSLYSCVLNAGFGNSPRHSMGSSFPLAEAYARQPLCSLQERTQRISYQR